MAIRMSKNKFYAVRAGRCTGIFSNWEDCEAAVKGYPGAAYKSFASLKEAEDYMTQDIKKPSDSLKVKNDKITEHAKTNKKQDKLSAYLDSVKETFDFSAIPKDTMIAYVDGSYDIKTQQYSFGCALLTEKDELRTEMGIGDNDKAKTARNVAGELMGTMFAVNKAAKEGYRNLIVYHDYLGISAWYHKKWKAESYCAVEYVSFMEKFRPFLNISFEKVESHTGVVLNEIADLLAKKALGI